MAAWPLVVGRPVTLVRSRHLVDLRGHGRALSRRGPDRTIDGRDIGPAASRRIPSPMRVWIDQDLCTGDGLCATTARTCSTQLEDGIAYVTSRRVRLNDLGRAGSPAWVTADPRRAVIHAAAGGVHLHRDRRPRRRWTADRAVEHPVPLPPRRHDHPDYLAEYGVEDDRG